MRPALIPLLALLLVAPAAADPRDPGARGPFRDAANWVRPPPAPGFSYPECVCTNRGERFPLGALSCLRVGGREFTAQCRESLNVTVWREVAEGCEAPGT